MRWSIVIVALLWSVPAESQRAGDAELDPTVAPDAPRVVVPQAPAEPSAPQEPAEPQSPVATSGLSANPAEPDAPASVPAGTVTGVPGADTQTIGPGALSPGAIGPQ